MAIRRTLGLIGGLAMLLATACRAHAAQEWVAAKRGLAHPVHLPQYDAPVGLTLESWWWTRS